jgi:hypothetical protein
MRYFRANVFRGLGHPLAALDIANKAFLVRVDFASRVRSGSLPAPRALKESCRFEHDLDQAAVWRQVRQPILAIYGENDRQVPPAESIARLAAAVEQSGNRDFTLIIYPDASHAVGKTRTGELGEEWTGYVPEYLEDMTDWVLQQASGVESPKGWSQRGRVTKWDQPFPAEHYDRLRWYGNAPVQVVQLFGFALTFLVVAVAGPVSMVRGRYGHQPPPASKLRRRLVLVATALSIVNLAVLAGLVWLTLEFGNQWEPRYPVVLNWLPLLGSLSVCLALTLLAILLTRWRAPADSRRNRIGWCLFATCAIAFLPFLHYWNLLGLSLH